MSSNNLKHSVLNEVEGFSELASALEALEKNGSDFREKKGATQQAISRLHPKRLRLIVTEIRQDTPSTKTLRLVPVDETGKPTESALPPFQAGQYINLFVTIDGVDTARPYAISSSPKERNYYDLTVKKLDSGFVSPYLVDRVKVSDVLSSSGPMGTFYHNPVHHGPSLVFLAGGSGIAPAMSMLKNVLEEGLPYTFHFIYASSFAEDIIFAQELRELALRYDNFNLMETVTRPEEGYSGRQGHISKAMITEALGEVSEQMFYICGPTPFNEHCVNELRALNVKSRRIRIEANGPPQNPSSIVGWPANAKPEDEVLVTIKGKTSFKVKKGEPLLNSLERNKQFIENACRSGECSLCRVKLLSGEVFNPPQSLLRKSDRQFGWIHSCVAYPLSDIELML